MSGRHVQIRCRVMVWPWGAIVSQDALGMDDGQLDRFISAGYAIEHEVDEPGPPTTDATIKVPSESAVPAVNPAPTADEAFADELIQTIPSSKPKSRRKAAGGASNG